MSPCTAATTPPKNVGGEGIGPALAGSKGERNIVVTAEVLFQPEIRIRYPERDRPVVGKKFQFLIIDEAGCMSEKVPDGDRRLDPVSGLRPEPWKILRSPVIQPEKARIDHCQRSGRHDRLGDRGITEDAVDLHGDTGFPVREPGSTPQQRLTVPVDQHPRRR